MGGNRLLDAGCWAARLGLFVVCLCGVGRLVALDLAGAREAMRTGDYAAVLKAAEARGDAREEREGWSLVHAEALTAVSRYSDALAVLDRAMSHDVQSIRVRWAARELGQALGDQDRVRGLSQEIAELVSRRRWAYRDPVNLVVFGRLALALGADPKDVLDRVFAVAQKAAPTLRDVYLARGELALEKHDFALAAKAFTEGSEKVPDDPDLLFGAARAFESGDRAAMLAALTAALKVNPRHVPSLLAQVDHLIDAEAYSDAGKKLDEIAGISPAHPELAAYRAVIAHLAGQPEEAAVARLQGLRASDTNPRVDHVIGRKLSQKYRFSEGAAAQREALKLDPDYLPAKAQLASDLLRLGKEDEGWALITEVNEKDGYDVEAYNLVTLRDTLSKYAVLKNEAFSIRMTQREADLYGPRVLALLTRARERLVSRYGVELAEPTIVDIFADQKDFAVRTFGLPDIQGFLGVCFGRVVTANSPAATGVAKGVNWESVLWHEYCHVVTLQFTRNKMPRWLSEGISVYEERQADLAWGMRLTPRYWEMLRSEDRVPIAELSSVFLAPPTPEHVQFAYYHSSLVVEFLIERFGFDALKGVLRSLRVGVDINEALAKHTVPMASLETEFAAFAEGRAKAFASERMMEKPPAALLKPGAEAELKTWLDRHPENLTALLTLARQAIAGQRWAEARDLAERAIKLVPDHTGHDGAYPLWVEALRESGDRAAERTALQTWTARIDAANTANLRLMTLAAADQDWPAVVQGAQRFLAVNPLVAAPYEKLALAGEAQGDLPAAQAAWRTLLRLDPPNPAEIHYRLADVLARAGDPAAKHHVLAALEDAPRHRSALALLLRLNRPAGSTP